MREEQDKEFIESVVNNIPTDVVVVDENLRIVFANENFYRHTKRKSEEIIGKSILEIVPKHIQKVSKVEDRIRNVLRTREPFDDWRVEVDIPCEGVDKTYIDARYVPFSVGRRRFVLITLQNVSKTANLERALKESEEKYRYLYEESPATSLIIGIDGTIKDVNKRALKKLGYSRDEIVGKKALDFVVPEHREKVIEHLERDFKGERTPEADFDVYAKDGSIHTILFSPGCAIIYEHGRPAGILITGIDITERKRIEAMLQESEERFRTIFETAKDSIFIKDRALRYVHVNPAMEKLFGLSASELIGKTDDELFGKEFGAHIRELDSHVLDGEIVEDEHTKPVRGAMRTFHVIKVPMRDSAGKVIGLCGIARDVTEKKRAEKALRESEERYRRLVEMSPDAVVVHSEGKLVYINKVGVKLLGASTPEELIGKPVLDFVHPKHREIVKERIKKLIEEREEVPLIEETLIRIDGTHINVEVAGIPFTYMGKPAVQLVVRDITDRKKAEKALKESEEKYRTLIENANDAIYILQEGMFKYVNPKFEELLEYSLEELREKDFMELVAPESREFIKERTEKREKGIAIPSRYEFKAISKSGRVIDFEANVTQIIFEGKDAVQGILRDITERKRLEEGQKKIIEELKEIDRAKTDFINTASHELKTPLTALVGYLDMIELGRFGEVSDELREKLNIMKVNTDRLHQIINELIDSARLIKGVELKPKKVSLVKTTNTAINLLKPLWEEKNLSIEFTAIEEIPEVEGDEEEILKLVNNLLSNAIKYSPKGESITISIDDKEDEIQFNIADKGTGIPEECIDKIFDKFYIVSSDDRYARVDGRLGLGLYIAKGIVERHGGKIWCESVFGVGSTFHFTLPKR